jgi:hypothetical protein
MRSAEILYHTPVSQVSDLLEISPFSSFFLSVLLLVDQLLFLFILLQVVKLVHSSILSSVIPVILALTVHKGFKYIAIRISTTDRRSAGIEDFSPLRCKRD